MKNSLRPEVGIQSKTIWNASLFQVPRFFAPDVKRGLRLLLMLAVLFVVLSWLSGGGVK